tara:strand:- start:3447 stop:4127 length:681 start_codon:yes stop_codon:yes gene_type:complete
MNIRSATAGLFVLVTASFSQSEDYTLSLDLTFDTKYVFRGAQLANNVFHPSIEFGKNDFYAGIWASQPIENRGLPDNWEDEVDFYVGQGWAIGEKTSVDFGAAYYYFSTSDSRLEPYVGVTREILGLAASFYLYNDLDIDATASEGSARYSVSLGAKRSVDLGANFGLLNVDNIGNYLYYGADVIFPVQIKENAVFSIGVHYSDSEEGSPTPEAFFHGSTSLRMTF